MVRRALQGEVQGYLQPDVARFRDEVVEVVDRAEGGVDGVVAARCRADGPRGPGVAGRRREGVVRALAVDLADRMDGREVDDVESHVGHGLQTLRRGGERPRRPGAANFVVGRALGAGEELVPGAVQRAFPVDEHRERTFAGQQVAEWEGVQGGRDLGARQGGKAHGDRQQGVSTRRRGRGEGLACSRRLRGVGRYRLQRPLQDQVALGEHQLDVDLGRDLDLRVVAPGGVRVRPGLDPEGPRPHGVRRDARLVAVREIQLGHVHEGPIPALGIGEHHSRPELVVSLPEDDCLDGEGLVDRSLDRVAAQLDDGADIRYRDALNHWCRTYRSS